MTKQVRWNIYYKKFQFILNNRQVFRTFVLDQRIDLSFSNIVRTVIKTLINFFFYNLLEKIVTIITSIYKKQIKLKGDIIYIKLVKNQ